MMNKGKLLWHLHKLIFKDIFSFAPTRKAEYAIAGGCIRALLTGDKVKDYDIFISSNEAGIDLIKFVRSKIELGEAEELSSNNRLYNFKYKDCWFQVILDKHFEFKGSTKLIDEFDFSICQAMVYHDTVKVKENNDIKETNLELSVGENFYEDNLSRHLRINKITYPFSTLDRFQRYIKKGYTGCRATLLKIGESFKDFDENRENITMLFYGMD